MPELKPITPGAIPAALAKAQRYRLLNDSAVAESICLDVLAADPNNTEAAVALVLALTDQFDVTHSEGLRRARETAGALENAYAHEYYLGLVCERWAKSVLRRGTPGAGAIAHDWIERALAHYARAETLRPAGDDDAVLRWNCCVRLLESETRLRPADPAPFEPELE